MRHVAYAVGVTALIFCSAPAFATTTFGGSSSHDGHDGSTSCSPSGSSFDGCWKSEDQGSFEGERKKKRFGSGYDDGGDKQWPGEGCDPDDDDVVDNNNPPPVPLPAGLPLLIGGVAALAGLRRRSKRRGA